MALERVVHTPNGGEVTRSAVASVLDYGFEGEIGMGELGDLVGAASAMAGARGATHLSILCSPSSPAHASLVARADNIDHYLMFCTEPEPADLAARGLYADHIYF